MFVCTGASKRLTSPCWRELRGRRLEVGRLRSVPGGRRSSGWSGSARTCRLGDLSGSAARWLESGQEPERWCRWPGVGGRLMHLRLSHPRARSVLRLPIPGPPAKRPRSRKLLAPRSQPLLCFHQKTRSAGLPFSAPPTRKRQKSPSQSPFPRILTSSPRGADRQR